MMAITKTKRPAHPQERSRGREGADERGRGADRPGEIPRKGWKDILLRVKKEQSEDNISIIAAGVAFYGLLAIFPALAALVSIYGLVTEPAEVQRQLGALSSFLPREALEIMNYQLSRIASQSGGALSIGLIVGILISIWSASKGMKALMTALNVVYDEEEKRGFFKLNSAALVLTFVGILFVIISLLLIAVLPALFGTLGLPDVIQRLLSLGRWPLLAAFVMFGLAALYRYAPSRDKPRWEWISWGAVSATLLWIAASVLFSLYAANFGNYNKTYGSVGAIIILLTWFYLTAYIVLLGGELNAEMEHQTVKDTTKGPERPLGERGAHVADTVGETP
ncbi:MAG TPA: YihY/virulence factor BrkB family protein [Thermodesulfobacteriota bacterium]|nr:YihY/virulence factor BrkB family protein [Thermodesulfobacteriota bacterium]